MRDVSQSLAICNVSPANPFTCFICFLFNLLFTNLCTIYYYSSYYLFFYWKSIGSENMFIETVIMKHFLNIWIRKIFLKYIQNSYNPKQNFKVNYEKKKKCQNKVINSKKNSPSHLSRLSIQILGPSPKSTSGPTKILAQITLNKTKKN